MVFESIVADLLNRFIGDYVENLDRKQLKIGIWGGDVVLNNLILKQSALNDLDLPVTTSYGHLGKLVLKIPWKNLYSSPVEAYVEKLYLLVVPNTAIRYDAEKEEKLEISTKKGQIERFEQVKKLEEEKDKPKGDKTFAEKLTTQIINNVQIKINDIHIRYEDNTTTGVPFAFGVTLSNLSVHTTNENWIQSLVAESVTRIFKVAQLEGLAVYMNCNTKLFQYDHQADFNPLFQNTIATKTSIPEGYNYILGPISSFARLQMVPNPESDEVPFSMPKVKLNLSLEKLALGITRLQYQDLIQLVETMGRMSRGVPYRKYRPYGITYKNHAKEWWYFAYECILETEVRRRKRNWSWEHIKTYRDKYRCYAEAYKTKLLAKKQTVDMISRCETLETDLDLNSILILRKKAELEVKKEEKDTQQVQQNQGWFGSWWSSSSKKPDTEAIGASDIKTQFEAAMTSSEKEKLFEAIGYHENAIATELPEHFIANFIDFELNSLEISVKSEVMSSTSPLAIENFKNIMKFKLKNVNCVIEQRPAASAIKLKMHLRELTVTGLQQDEFLPIMVQSRGESTKTLLDIMFETSPLDKKCDQRVRVSSRPLQIAYDAETVIELQKVFKTPETTTLAQWQDAAAVKLLDIKERSATGLQYAIHNHPRLEVNISLMPSYIVVPHGGKFQGKESVVVLSLGKLLMQTEPRPLISRDVKAMHESGASHDEILAEMILQSYDKFMLEIQNIQAIVAAPTENWQNTILENNVTDMHILQPTTLKLSAHLCVIEDDPRLPKCKIVGEIPKIHINVTERRILDAFSIVTSLPLPENEELQPKLLSKESNILSSSLSLLKFLDEKQKTISINKSETSAATGDELMDELVQFTDLEIKLVMSELCVTMHQPISDSDSSCDLFETPTEEFLPSTKQVVSFDVTDFPDQKKIIMFKLQQLELNMTQRTYDMRVGLILGAVAFDQFRFKNEKERIINVISTPKYENNLDYLFSLNYIDCKKTSPEFTTKHKSVEKLIEINFSTLLLVLHQEALIELIQLSNEFQSRMEAINRMNDKPRDHYATTYDETAANMIFAAAKDKLPVILEDETATAIPKRRDKRGTVVDSVKIKVLAKMEDVTVEMQTDKRSLACLEIKNLTANVLLKSTYTEVNLKLQDIIVTDTNPQSIHTKILSIVGDNAMACQIVMFNLDETSEYNSDNMRIDVTMGCAKIVFLNWFVTSVLNFLDHFQTAQQKIMDASAAVAEAAKTNVVEAYTQATRMRLIVKINAPIIIVPVASDSLEAIAIDLGHLNISNNFVDINTQDERSPAVIDEMKIELKDMKVSKVNVGQPTELSNSLSKFSSEDIVYGLDTGTNILNPTTFSLFMQRNLSSSWFKDRPEIDISGRLKGIELNVIANDYSVVMQILSKNMTEGQTPAKPTNAPMKSITANATTTRAEVNVNNKEDTKTKKIKGVKSQVSMVPQQSSIDTFLKFAFQIDSVTVNLFTVPDEGLARIALYFFSLKGKKLADGSLSTAIILCDVHLDDTRPNRENKITRFMERRQQIESFDENDPTLPPRSMIDITFNMKDADMFADVKVFSFNLIIYLDFLLKISNFFQTPALTEEQEFAQKQQIQAIRKSSSTQIQPAIEESKNITLMLHIEQPDIILVEKMDDINCYALIMNNEITVKVRLIGDKQIIQGEVTDFCLYLSEFNPQKRNTTKHYVIHPCSISLNGSTPDDKGLQLSLQSSDIKICISPAIIELLNNVTTTLTSTEQCALGATEEECDKSDLWEIKSFDDDQFWFIRVDEGEDALSLASFSLEEVKPELLLVDVPSIIIIIEAGSGVHTIPMLYVATSLEAKVNNWSSEMAIESALRLNMSYFNSTLALWEPLIEPVEKEAASGLFEFHPWELNFDLKVDKHREDPTKRDPTTKITISSKDTLELTATKTFLDVLQSLGKSFSEAISSDGLIKPECEAPYIIKNNTGMEIQINLIDDTFSLHPSHFSSPDNKLNESVVFDRSNEQSITFCIVLPGGKAYLQQKIDINAADIMNTTDMVLNSTEKFLHVQISDKKELTLPISRADKRYFPLYRDTNQEPWGIISEVTVEMGATIVTLRGILQVENHFTTTINVHSFSNNEAQLIAEIPPNTIYNIPLRNIHAINKDLHFSMNGYKLSVLGFSWKENPSDYNLLKSLQCDPVKSFEPLYMNAIRERHEVFHEVTSKYTMLSACFIIHIRPPLSVRNALPIDIILSIAGSSVAREPTRDFAENDQNVSVVEGEDFLDYGEKLVKPGELLYLPTVKTMSKSVGSHSYIVARLQQYLEKDWSCTTEIPSSPSDFGVWCFNSYDSVEKMSLNLGVRYENRNGGLHLTVYCPFWMLNKTGLMLTYRANDENTNLLYHPPEYDGPVLFSFREKAFFGKKKAAIRVDTGEWCDRFSLDVAGSSGVVTCRANDLIYQIGVHNTLTHNSLTKQIVFMPYYALINRAPFIIEAQEDKRSEGSWLQVSTDECIPFWPKAEKSELMRIKIADTTDITTPFNFNEVQCTLLPLKNKYGGVNVDVHVTEGAVYITFTSYYPGDAPALIINHTAEDVTFWEKGNINARTLSPNQMMFYAWMDAVGEKQLIWNNGTHQIENDLRKDGVEKFRISDHPEEAFWVSFLDGTQRVLLFTKNPDVANGAESASDFVQVTQEIIMDIHGLGLSLVNNTKKCELMYIGVTSSGVIWEEKKSRFKSMKIQDSMVVEKHFQEYLIEQQFPQNQKKKYFLEVGKNEIDFEHMILKKSNEREIRRTFYPGVWLEMKSSSHQLQLHVKINRIQIDNQLPDCIFPVVLAPIPPPKSVAALTEMKPFIEMSVVQRIIPHSTVKQFKYMKLLTQEFHVKVDLIFLNEIFEMLSSETTEEESKKLFAEDLKVQSQPLLAHVSQHSQQELKNFYDNLHLGPLKIHVSFSMAGSETTTLPSILSTLLQGVGVTLTDVNDVVFRLAFFEREYQFLTQRQLVSQCISHYAGQAVKQLYVLVLGLDVIGNPYGLVVGFTKGVEDLFYEPFQGAIQGPGEFAEGLVLGVKSLFGHTVGGAAGAVSKITGAMGKGVAALTFDKNYQKSRRDALNKKPANLQEGLARSGKGLVMGVFDGVTGVVTKPISGARSEGVGGFFKGLGQGAVGLVARPTAGVIDFASGSFDAVKRATELSDEAMRIRPPRFIQPDGIVRPYSKRDAEGHKYFRELDKGKYASSDNFEYFEEIVPKRDIIILTNHRIIYAVKNDLFGGWQSEFTYKWQDINQIRSVDKGIEIILKSREGKSKIFKMFGSADVNLKLIIMNQLSRRDQLYETMNKLKNK